MAVSHVGTASNTIDNGTSVTTVRPAGSSSGDLMLAFFTSNAQDVTTPAGWTEIADETIDSFRLQVFRKVVGSGEAASYNFSVGSAAPLVLTITALRGVNTSSPIDVTPVAAAITTSSEPYTTPATTGGTAGRMVYLRAVRYPGTTVPTFTGAGATELMDVGVFSGGSVCYAHGLYLATSDYLSSGAKSGHAITTSQSESHNIAISLGVKANTIPATMAFDLILPTMTSAGAVAIPGDLEVDMPLPEFDGEIFNGEYEGTLDTVVPVLIDVDGYSDGAGVLDADIVPVMDLQGETRRFSDNVVTTVRDHRWIVVTQDGYYLGTRAGSRDFKVTIRMPLLQVQFEINVSALGHTQLATVEAFQPSIISSTTVENDITVSVTANDATVLTGEIPTTGSVSVSAAAFQPSIATTFSAGTTEVTAEVFESKPFAIDAEIATLVTATANDAEVNVGVAAYAEHVRVRAVNIAYVPVLSDVSATATANDATVSTIVGTSAAAEEVSVAVSTEDITVGSTTTVEVESVSVTVSGWGAFGTRASAELVEVSVTLSDPEGAHGVVAFAELVEVTAYNFASPDAPSASASVTASDADVSFIPATIATAGHVSVTCHS